MRGREIIIVHERDSANARAGRGRERNGRRKGTRTNDMERQTEKTHQREREENLEEKQTGEQA